MRAESCLPVEALLVNRPAGRFIPRTGSAGSKGCAPACPVVKTSAVRRCSCTQISCGARQRAIDVAPKIDGGWKTAATNSRPLDAPSQPPSAPTSQRTPDPPVKNSARSESPASAIPCSRTQCCEPTSAQPQPLRKSIQSPHSSPRIDAASEKLPHPQAPQRPTPHATPAPVPPPPSPQPAIFRQEIPTSIRNCPRAAADKPKSSPPPQSTQPPQSTCGLPNHHHAPIPHRRHIPPSRIPQRCGNLRPRASSRPSQHNQFRRSPRHVRVRQARTRIHDHFSPCRLHQLRHPGRGTDPRLRPSLAINAQPPAVTKPAGLPSHLRESSTHFPYQALRRAPPLDQSSQHTNITKNIRKRSRIDRQKRHRLRQNRLHGLDSKRHRPNQNGRPQPHHLAHIHLPTITHRRPRTHLRHILTPPRNPHQFAPHAQRKQYRSNARC